MKPDRFVVVKHPRRQGFTIKAPAGTTWAIGPGRTFGWFKLKRDAAEWAKAHNDTNGLG